MATYRVRRWHEHTLKNECIRHTRTSAANCAHDLAYDALEAFGKLDTIAAHNVMNTMNASADDLLPVGAGRSYVISNTGYLVSITRLA